MISHLGMNRKRMNMMGWTQSPAPGPGRGPHVMAGVSPLLSTKASTWRVRRAWPSRNKSQNWEKAFEHLPLHLRCRHHPVVGIQAQIWDFIPNHRHHHHSSSVLPAIVVPVLPLALQCWLSSCSDSKLATLSNAIDKPGKLAFFSFFSMKRASLSIFDMSRSIDSD